MKTITGIHGTTRFALPVEIKLDEKTKALAMARNISTEGMFLQLEEELLRSSANIHLTCRLNDMHWSIKATVIHATPRGLGVKFCQPQHHLMRAICARLPQLAHPIAGHFSLA